MCIDLILLISMILSIIKVKPSMTKGLLLIIKWNYILKTEVANEKKTIPLTYPLSNIKSTMDHEIQP